MKKLDKRKELASKVLRVGKGRICFDSSRLAEIKEAITKQDIKDLYAEGIISIKPVSGRKKIKKRKTKRGFGKKKRRINNRKEGYVKLVRKLRDYVKELRKQGLDNEAYNGLRKKIKAKSFRSKSQLKEYIETEKLK